MQTTSLFRRAKKRNRIHRTGLVSLVAAVLIAGVLLQRKSISTTTVRNRPKDYLERIIPKQLDEWTGVDLPLGPTEAQSADAAKTLSFDSYVYRRYTKRGSMFDLYLAYWSPARMPAQLVARHTPDRCWVQAGWGRIDAAHEIAVGPLAGAEWRIFDSPSGHRTYVNFWHFVGGVRYNDHGQRYSSLKAGLQWWISVVRQLSQPPANQYFIRISSDRPLEELMNDADYVRLLNNLHQLISPPNQTTPQLEE